jgi:hypothetical protein
MPLINRRISLLANGTANAVAGDQYEYLPFPASIEIGMSADATGVLATVFSGSDLLMGEGPVQIGTINVQPKYPDDFQLTDVAAAGDRLSVNLRDTSGVARTVMVQVRITPL